MPRLPDSHLSSPSELAGRLPVNHSIFNSYPLNFHLISGGFSTIFFSSRWAIGGIYDGSDCHRHPPVITRILDFSVFCDTF
jgi:hypothetical protein